MPNGLIRQGVSLGDLNVDFVGFDHTQLISGPLFDHVQAFLEVVDLGTELFNSPAGFFVGYFLLLQLSFQLRNIGQTAPTQPKLDLDDGQQGDQYSRDEAFAHVV